MAWRAYVAVFKNSFIGQLEYRSETIIRILIAFISLVSVFYLWNDVYGSQAVLAGYTKPQIITYYLLVAYIYASIYTSLPISMEIMEGELSTYLLRPMHYLWYHYWYSLARRVYRLALGLPVLIILFWLLREHIFLVSDPKAYAVLLLLAFGAMNILFLVDALRNIMEFWVVNSGGWDMILDALISFFAGTLIPLSFLPSWLQALADILPFKYTGAFLADAFMGRITWMQIGWGFLGQTVWTLALAVILNAAWQRGLRRYEAYGN